ncbi:pre-rRNA-processing protein TSR2 [Trypanosoma rangeli]|uniref:Pre-rRNA-processing protein TSR2 n=1 Tax=Trypanosoma rangeli TaxID=5698 RepID=A0A422N5E3_TRYRA|nr:pre-rRNA-processing protein TSR2 [Trypanosoma rangeli]RNF00651.1 pre-rRNA-processing protein TSR2 [Trypanosoma rangeli]|eukprot:RNF00651.1 pre-rRNA-processing protein TSR2 [Trypanosoma rangeli]
MQPQQQQQQPLPPGFPLVRSPYRATEAQFQAFVRGLDAVLNQWTALHLVAQHCDGLALQSMYQELIAWFLSEGELYSDDLEIFFENFFTEARSVVIEDDSMKEVGDVLHEMYCRCCQNDFSLVEQYLASWEVYRQVNPVRLSVDAGGNDDEDGVDDAVGAVLGTETQDMHPTAKEAEESDGMMPSAQQKPWKKKGKKNAYERDSDGWCTVQR